MISVMTIVKGNAMIIHVPKEIGGAFGNVSSKTRCNARFGGVPTRVAMPPIDEA